MNEQFGPTNNFPDGKIHESDDGELQLGIGVHEDNVIIQFGIPVAWIGLSKEQAISFAELIIENANQIQ